MATNSTSFHVNLVGNVAAQAKKFEQSIVSMTNRSNRYLNGLKNTIAGVSKGLDFSAKNVSLFGIGLGASFAMAAKSTIKTAAEFEMAGIRMKQTFGDRGDEATAWLKKFATDTPMAFGDVQDAMMRLQTAGIDPMNGSLQALVDYNAKVGGSAENLNGYISAISKGFIKGKLSMEEINPLLERNVKVFEILAAETGGKYTAEQMQKMLQEGKLGRKAIAALLRGMGKDAKGAAKEQMKTWDGLVSNLGDTFTSMQASFMQKGVFDELKKELGGILDWLNQKIESGEFDEFAKQVNDTLVQALHDLKDVSKEVKPILENIGSVMSWLSEKAGGYGNLAKFAAALYGANKLARSGIGQAVGRGAWGVGKWGAGKLFGKKGTASTAGGVAGTLGNVAGVTPVFVTNFADMGFGGRAGRQGGRGGYRARNTASKVATTAVKTAKTATKSIKQTATNTMKSTATATKNMAGTVTKGMKGIPALGAGLAMAEGAMVMMDDSATTQEKSESIGSIAGATAGAIVGQALIPIPVVGAMVGSFVGDWLGGWLGSEVGEMLSSPEVQETKLDGSIKVEIKTKDNLVATVGTTNIRTSNPRSDLEMATITGNSGRFLYGGD